MPKRPRRSARAKTLVRLYTKLRQGYEQRKRRRISRLKRLYRLLSIPSTGHLSMSSLSSESSPSTLSDTTDSLRSEDEDNTSEDSWAEVLGSDWWQGRRIMGSDTSLASDGDSDNPELVSQGDHHSDSSSASSGYSGDAELSLESGLEVSDDEDAGEESSGDRWARLRRWVRQSIAEMYVSRYEMPRNEIPRGPSRMHHVLFTLKSARPDQFREELRVTPRTFDVLVTKLQYDIVFRNNSRCPQMPVEEQLAIALFRFGHDGNAASLQGVANWAAVGKGTVLLVTRRVMTAILRPGFMNEAVRFPDPEEKEAEKKWVHRHSCRAWRNGWCLVDGTLVPLAERPHWFGESYFDRKNRYSLNIQARLSRLSLYTSI
jgi:hypothetical protein